MSRRVPGWVPVAGIGLLALVGLRAALAAPAAGLLIVDGEGRERLRCRHPVLYVAQLKALECLPLPGIFANGFEGAPHDP